MLRQFNLPAVVIFVCKFFFPFPFPFLLFSNSQSQSLAQSVAHNCSRWLGFIQEELLIEGRRGMANQVHVGFRFEIVGKMQFKLHILLNLLTCYCAHLSSTSHLSLLCSCYCSCFPPSSPPPPQLYH